MQACQPISFANSGSAMIKKLVAEHLICDFDTIQGHQFTTLFFPLTAARVVANVPIYLAPDARVKNQLFTCIELVDGSQLATYNGVDMPSSFTAGWLTLRDNCKNILAEMPLSSLNRVLNGDKNRFFRKLPVDWSQSFIKLTSTAGLSSAGFLFRIWTVKP
jgi:hypothetical protein